MIAILIIVQLKQTGKTIRETFYQLARLEQQFQAKIPIKSIAEIHMGDKEQLIWVRALDNLATNLHLVHRKTIKVWRRTIMANTCKMNQEIWYQCPLIANNMEGIQHSNRMVPVAKTYFRIHMLEKMLRMLLIWKMECRAPDYIKVDLQLQAMKAIVIFIQNW